MSKFHEAATTHEETFPLTNRIEELESLLKSYQDQLAQTKSTLIRERATRNTGDSSSNERILELKSSPSNIEQQCRLKDLERLRIENRDLLDELKSYQYDDTVNVGEKRKRELNEASSSSILPSTSSETTVSSSPLSSPSLVQVIKIPQSTLDNLQTQVETLKNEVASREKRILRVGQVKNKETMIYKCHLLIEEMDDSRFLMLLYLYMCFSFFLKKRWQREKLMDLWNKYEI